MKIRHLTISVLYLQCYLRHLTSKPSENEDFGTFGDLDRELVLEQVRGSGPEPALLAPADLTATSGLVDDPSLLLPPQTPATPASTQKQKPGRKRKAHELDDTNQVSER